MLTCQSNSLQYLSVPKLTYNDLCHTEHSSSQHKMDEHPKNKARKRTVMVSLMHFISFPILKSGWSRFYMNGNYHGSDYTCTCKSSSHQLFCDFCGFFFLQQVETDTLKHNETHTGFICVCGGTVLCCFFWVLFTGKFLECFSLGQDTK
jgi:hypothetical protein